MSLDTDFIINRTGAAKPEGAHQHQVPFQHQHTQPTHAGVLCVLQPVKILSCPNGA
jgi:hypothetical protein